MKPASSFGNKKKNNLSHIKGNQVITKFTVPTSPSKRFGSKQRKGYHLVDDVIVLDSDSEDDNDTTNADSDVTDAVASTKDISGDTSQTTSSRSDEGRVSFQRQSKPSECEDIQSEETSQNGPRTKKSSPLLQSRSVWATPPIHVMPQTSHSRAATPQCGNSVKPTGPKTATDTETSSRLNGSSKKSDIGTTVRSPKEKVTNSETRSNVTSEVTTLATSKVTTSVSSAGPNELSPRPSSIMSKISQSFVVSKVTVPRSPSVSKATGQTLTVQTPVSRSSSTPRIIQNSPTPATAPKTTDPTRVSTPSSQTKAMTPVQRSPQGQRSAQSNLISSPQKSKVSRFSILSKVSAPDPRTVSRSKVTNPLSRSPAQSKVMTDESLDPKQSVRPKVVNPPSRSSMQSKAMSSDPRPTKDTSSISQSSLLSKVASTQAFLLSKVTVPNPSSSKVKNSDSRSSMFLNNAGQKPFVSKVMTPNQRSAPHTGLVNPGSRSSTLLSREPARSSVIMSRSSVNLKVTTPDSSLKSPVAQSTPAASKEAATVSRSSFAPPKVDPQAFAKAHLKMLQNEYGVGDLNMQMPPASPSKHNIVFNPSRDLNWALNRAKKIQRRKRMNELRQRVMHQENSTGPPNPHKRKEKASSNISRDQENSEDRKSTNSFVSEISNPEESLHGIATDVSPPKETPRVSVVPFSAPVVPKIYNVEKQLLRNSLREIWRNRSKNPELSNEDKVVSQPTFVSKPALDETMKQKDRHKDNGTLNVTASDVAHKTVAPGNARPQKGLQKRVITLPTIKSGGQEIPLNIKPPKNSPLKNLQIQTKKEEKGILNDILDSCAYDDDSDSTPKSPILMNKKLICKRTQFYVEKLKKMENSNRKVAVTSPVLGSKYKFQPNSNTNRNLQHSPKDEKKYTIKSLTEKNRAKNYREIKENRGLKHSFRNPALDEQIHQFHEGRSTEKKSLKRKREDSFGSPDSSYSLMDARSFHQIEKDSGQINMFIEKLFSDSKIRPSRTERGVMSRRALFTSPPRNQYHHTSFREGSKHPVRKMFKSSGRQSSDERLTGSEFSFENEKGGLGEGDAVKGQSSVFENRTLKDKNDMERSEKKKIINEKQIKAFEIARAKIALNKDGNVIPFAKKKETMSKIINVHERPTQKEMFTKDSPKTPKTPLISAAKMIFPPMQVKKKDFMRETKENIPVRRSNFPPKTSSESASFMQFKRSNQEEGEKEISASLLLPSSVQNEKSVKITAPHSETRPMVRKSLGEATRTQQPPRNRFLSDRITKSLQNLHKSLLTVKSSERSNDKVQTSPSKPEAKLSREKESANVVAPVQAVSETQREQLENVKKSNISLDSSPEFSNSIPSVENEEPLKDKNTNAENDTEGDNNDTEDDDVIFVSEQTFIDLTQPDSDSEFSSICGDLTDDEEIFPLDDSEDDKAVKSKTELRQIGKNQENGRPLDKIEENDQKKATSLENTENSEKISEISEELFQTPKNSEEEFFTPNSTQESLVSPEKPGAQHVSQEHGEKVEEDTNCDLNNKSDCDLNNKGKENVENFDENQNPFESVDQVIDEMLETEMNLSLETSSSPASKTMVISSKTAPVEGKTQKQELHMELPATLGNQRDSDLLTDVTPHLEDGSQVLVQQVETLIKKKTRHDSTADKVQNNKRKTLEESNKAASEDLNFVAEGSQSEPGNEPRKDQNTEKLATSPSKDSQNDHLKKILSHSTSEAGLQEKIDVAINEVQKIWQPTRQKVLSHLKLNEYGQPVTEEKESNSGDIEENDRNVESTASSHIISKEVLHTEDEHAGSYEDEIFSKVSAALQSVLDSVSDHESMPSPDSLHSSTPSVTCKEDAENLSKSFVDNVYHQVSKALENAMSNDLDSVTSDLESSESRSSEPQHGIHVADDNFERKLLDNNENLREIIGRNTEEPFAEDVYQQVSNALEQALSNVNEEEFDLENESQDQTIDQMGPFGQKIKENQQLFHLSFSNVPPTDQNFTVDDSEQGLKSTSISTDILLQETMQILNSNQNDDDINFELPEDVSEVPQGSNSTENVSNILPHPDFATEEISQGSKLTDELETADDASEDVLLEEAEQGLKLPDHFSEILNCNVDVDDSITEMFDANKFFDFFDDTDAVQNESDEESLLPDVTFVCVNARSRSKVKLEVKEEKTESADELAEDDEISDEDILAPLPKKQKLENKMATRSRSIEKQEVLMSNLLSYGLRSSQPSGSSQDSLSSSFSGSELIQDMEKFTSRHEPPTPRLTRKRKRSIGSPAEKMFGKTINPDTSFQTSYKKHGGALSKLVKQKLRECKVDRMEEILLSDLKKGGFRQTLENAEASDTRNADLECDVDTKRALDLMKKDWGTLPELSTDSGVFQGGCLRHCHHRMALRSCFSSKSFEALPRRLKRMVTRCTGANIKQNLQSLSHLLNEVDTRIQTFHWALQILQCHPSIRLVEEIVQSNLKEKKFHQSPYSYLDYKSAFMDCGARPDIFGNQDSGKIIKKEPQDSMICENCLRRRRKRNPFNMMSVVKILGIATSLYPTSLQHQQQTEVMTFLLHLLQDKNFNFWKINLTDVIVELMKNMNNWSSTRILLTRQVLSSCPKLHVMQEMAVALRCISDRCDEVSRILSFAILKLHVYGEDVQSMILDDFDDVEALVDIVDHLRPDNLELLLTPEEANEEEMGSQKRSFYHLSLLLPMLNICIGYECKDTNALVSLERISSILRMTNKRIRDNGAIYRSQVKYELSLFIKNLRNLIMKAPKVQQASIFKYLRSAPVHEEIIKEGNADSDSSDEGGTDDIPYNDGDDEVKGHTKGERSRKKSVDSTDELYNANEIKKKILRR